VCASTLYSKDLRQSFVEGFVCPTHQDGAGYTAATSC
jgi:hypothetical protein